MQNRTEEVETTLCDSLYSLKPQVQVLHQQLQFHSNVYAVRTKEVETLCDSLCIITNFLNYFIDVAESQLIVNSPHQEILSILLQNTSRDMLICTCLLNFHDNRAAFFKLSCS